MTQQPGGPAEAAFAVASAPARRRSAEIGTSRAGEKKATEAGLRHGASPELLPEMADQLWRANPLQRLLPISWGEVTRALMTLSARSMADPVHCVYRKPIPGRSGDEVRQGSRVNERFRSTEWGERPAHLYPRTSGS